MDYVLNIYRNEKFLFAIGGKHMNYDNIIWWQLGKLVNIIEEFGEENKEILIDKIVNNTEYFKIVLNKVQKCGCDLDVTNKTITVDHIQLYDLDEGKLEDFGRELKLIEGNYLVQYEGIDELFEVNHETFDIELLGKKLLTFDELKVVDSFIDSLICNDKTDIILNNKKYLLLTEI